MPFTVFSTGFSCK